MILHVLCRLTGFDRALRRAVRVVGTTTGPPRGGAAMLDDHLTRSRQ